MVIELSNGYFIEVDPLNYTLKQKSIKVNEESEKREVTRVHGYYSKLEDALMGFLKHNQIDYMADLSMDLDTYLQMVRDANLLAVQAIKCILGVVEDCID